MCEAPAVKEDPVNHQQGKKIHLDTSRKRRPCYLPAGKQDPVAQQQGKKIVLSFTYDV